MLLLSGSGLQRLQGLQGVQGLQRLQGAKGDRTFLLAGGEALVSGHTEDQEFEHEIPRTQNLCS